MKTLALILTVFMAFPAFSGQRDVAVEEALQKIFKDPETDKFMNPGQVPLRTVVDGLFWNYQSGTISESDIRLLRENIQSDSGAVATELFDRGFNYQVLVFLRRVLQVNRDNIDYGIIDASSIPAHMTSGVAEFLDVDEKEWATLWNGNLEMRQYDKKIFWLLQQTRYMTNRSIEAAAAKRHNLADVFFFNRHNRILTIINFLHRTERYLIQYQSLLSTLDIRIVESQGQPEQAQIESLKADVKTKVHELMGHIEAVLEKGQPGSPKDKTPWREFFGSIKNGQTELSRKEQELTEYANEVLVKLDQILGRDNSLDEMYEDDEIPELVIALEDHRQQFKGLSDAFDASKEFTYFDRKHKWLYEHYHSEEHGPYTLQERYYKSRDIHTTEVAPEEEETEVVSILRQMSGWITNSKLNQEQIAVLRARAEELQQAHNAHVARGPQPSRNIHANAAPEFSSRFVTRNKIISDWIALMIKSTYRHAAHEKKNYVGIEFETPLTPAQQLALDKLGDAAKKIRIIRYGLGGSAGTAVAGSCGWYLADPDGFLMFMNQISLSIQNLGQSLPF